MNNEEEWTRWQVHPHTQKTITSNGSSLASLIGVAVGDRVPSATGTRLRLCVSGSGPCHLFSEASAVLAEGPQHLAGSLFEHQKGLVL